MPCRDETHEHQWPKAGTLTICRCEIFCGYCEGEDAKKVYTLQWELRHHIRVIHAGSQGLDVKVSPRPMPHVSTNSKKRNHAEVEQSETDEDDDSEAAESSEEEEEEEEEEATKDESSEEDSKSKPKPLILHSRAPSDPFVDAVKKDTKPVPGPLRLRAKPVARSKKAPLSSHAASFKPIGPKPGPSSPKRAKQEVPTGPSLPVAASMAPEHQLQGSRTHQSAAPSGSVMNNQPANSVILDQQRAQLLARRAAEVHTGVHVQRPVGNPQQMPNNAPPRGRNNIGPAINAQPAQMPGPNYNRPPASVGLPPNNQMNIAPPPLYFHASEQGFYRRDYQFPEQHADIPPELLRIRSLTRDLLTNHNTSEMLLINMYSAEVEFIRQLQTRRWISNAHDQSYVNTLHHSGLLAQQQIQQKVTSPMMQQFVGGCVRGHLSNLGFLPRQVQGQGGQQQMGQEQMGQEQMGQQQMGQQQGVRPGQQPGLQQQGTHQYAPRPMQQMNVQQPGQTQQVGGQKGGPQSQPPQRNVSGGQQLQQPPQRQVPGGQQLGPRYRPIQPQISAGQQPIAQRANSQQPGSHQTLQQLGLRQLGPQQLVARQHPPPIPSPQQLGPMLPIQQQPNQQRSGPQQLVARQQPPQQPVSQATEPQQHHPAQIQGQPPTGDPVQVKIEEQIQEQKESQDKKPHVEKMIKEETV